MAKTKRSVLIKRKRTRSLRFSSERHYLVKISGEIINVLHHNIAYLLNLAKSHKNLKDNAQCILYLKEIKDILDELTNRMEEIE